MSKIKFSAFADEVTSDFQGQVKFLVDQDVPAIEIRFVDNKNIMDLTKKELEKTRKILLDNGISVSAIGSPIGKVSLQEPFNKHLDKFKHAIELANYFDTPFIRVFSYYAPEGENIDNYREEVVERISRQAELLQNTEIVMVHENEADIYGHSAKNCADLAKAVNSPAFGLAYDPANFVWGEKITNNMEKCWPLMEPYVVHVHIKDWGLGNTVGSLPGEGDGQIKQLLSELNKKKYNGFLTMEPHLRVGGQFGGETGPELFYDALEATRTICSEVGLSY
ncbi:MAG: sugar phosphate isomerase/epimerase family protein [Gillisia sp.]